MKITVTGKAVCGYCRGDVAAMAEKAGLKSLTIKETATGNFGDVRHICSFSITH
jgi:filamentous hemagglutinin